MSLQKLSLPHALFWDPMLPDDLKITLRIENSTDESLRIGVDWCCFYGDRRPHTLVDGTIHLRVTPCDSFDWEEELLDEVTPGKSKTFFCGVDEIRQMLAASEVMSPDLIRLSANLNGERYEILSGSELYIWLNSKLPRKFLI